MDLAIVLDWVLLLAIVFDIFYAFSLGNWLASAGWFVAGMQLSRSMLLMKYLRVSK